MQNLGLRNVPQAKSAETPLAAKRKKAIGASGVSGSLERFEDRVKRAAKRGGLFNLRPNLSLPKGSKDFSLFIFSKILGFRGGFYRAKSREVKAS